MMKIFWPNMFLLFIFLAIACKKEKVPAPIPTPSPKSIQELLTQKEWLLVSVGADINSNGVIDTNEEAIINCQKDNTIKFNIDGTGFSSDKGLRCDVLSEAAFNWVFATDNKTLILDGPKVITLNLDENEFRYTPDINGVVGEYIITYRH